MLTNEITVFDNNRLITAIEYRWENNGFGENTKEMRTAMAAFITGRMRKITRVAMHTDFMIILKSIKRFIQLSRPDNAAGQKEDHHDFND